MVFGMPETIIDFLSKGFATQKEIQNHTGMSQPVISRKLQQLEDRVVRVKHGRSILYAVTRNAFGSDDDLPLVTVDAYGNTVPIATIRPLAHAGFLVIPFTGLPPVFLGESGIGLYDDLPYFLLDLCPQGFLGRQIAAEISSQTQDFPSDPRNWSTSHIGRYLISNGDDLPGNLKFGHQAMIRLRRKAMRATESDYPALANSVLEGEIPGSSAGGEQPKFTTYNPDRSSHVIVKFSPTGDNEISLRWRDILITEYHASETLHAEGFPAAETKLIEIGDRLFLESLRFDRTGDHGRMSMISLQSIDNEFTGVGSGWPQVLKALLDKGLVSWSHVFDVECLWIFGKLIYNTDMHLGNLSFAADGNVFRLLPVYDMCCMGFAPRSGGEILPYSFSLPDISMITIRKRETMSSMVNLAHAFWEKVKKDPRISEKLRVFLDQGNPVTPLTSRFK